MRNNILKISFLLVFCISHIPKSICSPMVFDEVDSLQAALSGAAYKDSIDILTQLGRLHFRADNFQLALENFYMAFRICDKTDDKKGKATLINNIAAIYYKTDDLDKALEYFIQSLEIEDEIGNKSGVSKSLNNIAIIYNEMGLWEKSLEYYEKALSIRDSLKDEEGKATVYNNMGLVYLKQHDYHKAISYYKKAERIYTEAGKMRSAANTLGNISRAYLFMKQYDKARQFAEKSIKYSEPLGSLLINRDNYQTLYTLYKETGDFQKALEYFEKYESIKDSLNSARVEGQIDDIKVKYETERQMKENAMLKSEKEAQSAIIKTQKIFGSVILVVLVLVSILSYLLYKNSIIKKESIRLLEEQNKEIEIKRFELEKLNQVKNKIFSVISHEIRSPLNSLVGTVDLLTSGYLSPEEFFQLSTDLKQKVNQTSNFLNNILLWAKAQMEGIKKEKEEFSLENLINESLDLLKEQADIKGVEIEREFKTPFSIVADKNMIGIVTKNLISNAIKFTKQGKKVVLKTYKKENEIVVEVEDQGMGIPKILQPKILTSEAASATGLAGETVTTGLGLILSKMLVEENGGRIWLESEEGKGSKFCFSIPLN